MKLIFGLQLDDLVLPHNPNGEGGSIYCGPKKILTVLESHLGLVGHAENIEFLRIEQYRQAILLHVSRSADPSFYQKSFEADQFATAAEMLSRRDELLLGGWSSLKQNDTPARLSVLSELESLFAEKTEDTEKDLHLSPGYADRFIQVVEKIKILKHPFTEISLNEPLNILPSHFQQLFKLMEKTGEKTNLRTVEILIDTTAPKTDLQKFQKLLNKAGQQNRPDRNQNFSLSSDGSLIIIKAKRASEAAAYFAKLLKLNPEFRPACLIPEKNRTLDIALVQEGLPSLGILSASLARPALQILKLAPTFLWQPIDPFKILEFVSLAIKPLPADLANLLALQMARTPGLHGEGWFAMVNSYFSELEERETQSIVKAQRKQYQFWFERQRHYMNQKVPKNEVLEIFDYLHDWAFKTFEENGSKNNSLLVLSEQAKRIAELLQALPETELAYLDLERIVRTIYEPSPIVFQERELGHLPFVMQASAFIGKTDKILWWNFIQNEPPHFFSRWYPSERSYLTKLHVALDIPENENARLLWQRKRPVLLAEKQLILVIPEVADGKSTLPHPLLSSLEAAFDNLEAIIFQVSYSANAPLGKLLTLPNWEKSGHQRLGEPKPFLEISNMDKLDKEYETLTSLDSLFYYPYQWFFRYKIKLHKSAILSVVKDNALMGNLAHRVFEKLLKEENIHEFDKTALESWVEKESRRLLAREGAVLLMYGREPERIAFIQKLKYAAWSLLSHIRENGWKVKKTEMELQGEFPSDSQCQVKGIADLVLEKEGELVVIDLKWRGASFRANVLRNEQDLQLVLYAHLLKQSGSWPHTSYFIMENGKMIARNNLAFKNIVPLAPKADFAAINKNIKTRMEATWKWRMAQLAKGQLEIRCRQTLPDIEEYYGRDGQGELMLEILEMKGEDAKWDDYRTLINLVE